MGEVRRVKDTVLDRILAMKIVRWDSSRERFEAEARTTAKLQHPAIVALHDYGELDDGRLWFTMPEVRGRTFREVLYSLHSASQFGSWGTTGDGWTFRRLMAAFETACQAVAFAHKGGVLHRDLKPDNIMVGAFGEVLVMDWGLAQIMTTQTTGSVQGTPSYMSPEQAWGRELTAASDVYSLGTVLYEILAGRPPFSGQGTTIARQLKAGAPPTVSEAVGPGHPPIPAELLLLTEMAMSREPRDRPPDASVFSAELRLWLEGARRREQGLRLVSEADTLAPDARRKRAQARQLRKQAGRVLSELQPHDPVESKAVAWDDEDRAAELDRLAELAETRMEQALRAALNHDPVLPEAHQRLADHYRGRLEKAEARRDPSSIARYEELLRSHDRGRHADYLAGSGRVSLSTDPPGATVRLYRFERRQRRLELVPVGSVAQTPMVDFELEQGSWLLRIDAPGCEPLDYPVHIGRGEQWTDRDRAGNPFVLQLPPSGSLGPDQLAVPPGWFIAGGDEHAPDGLPRRRMWADGFVVDRHPVTVGDYIAWLDTLDDPTPHLPSIDGRPLTRTEDGGLAGAPRSLAANDPICLVSWNDAQAYAAAMGARLLHDHEWEKAARGVDGRAFPWGDFFDSTWCNASNSRASQPWLVPISSNPEDISPYGVRGLAGNLRDWCSNDYERSGPTTIDHSPGTGPFRMARGGSWSSSGPFCRAAARVVGRPDARTLNYGFRLARDWPTRAG